jgi:hypothetical protein
LAVQRDRQRELNPSRLDKIVDDPMIQSDGREFINSYDYYGENQAQNKDYASVQRNQPKPDQSKRPTQAGASKMSASNGKKTNFVEVLDIGDDEHAPITSQYFSEEEDGTMQPNESGDLLKKLIDNIQNNHALKND